MKKELRWGRNVTLWILYSKNDGIKAVSHGLAMEKRVLKFSFLSKMFLELNDRKAFGDYEKEGLWITTR